jgi:hypothetical protein
MPESLECIHVMSCHGVLLLNVLGLKHYTDCSVTSPVRSVPCLCRNVNYCEVSESGWEQGRERERESYARRGMSCPPA